jgi:hypothetical protein
MREIRYVFVYVVAVFLYCLPTIIAQSIRHPYRWPITAINLVLGVLGIPWIFCLVWALWPQEMVTKK